MIVGIGELLWDLFPDGRKVAGGAPFNFAFHCQQLGHEAAIVSRVGDDDLGRELREEIRRLGITDTFVQTDREHPTGTVPITVDQEGQPSYTFPPDVAWDFIEWTESLAELAGQSEVVCFGTLAQRSRASQGSIDQMIASCRNAIRIFDANFRHRLDIESYDRVLKLIKECDWLKVNENEIYQILFDVSETQICEPVSPKESSIRYVFDTRMDPRRVGILTRGKKGVAVTDWQRTEWVPGVSVDVIDTVGAGDAFTAAMVCLHLEGRPLRDCARFANHYAARVCEHRGATPIISRADIERVAFGS